MLSPRWVFGDDSDRLFLRQGKYCLNVEFLGNSVYYRNEEEEGVHWYFHLYCLALGASATVKELFLRFHGSKYFPVISCIISLT